MQTQPSRFSLKELQTRRNQLQAEQNRLKLEVKEKTDALVQCNQRLASVNKEIDLMTKEPMVTEHALLRYCERVLKIDMDAIKATILSETTLKQSQTLGNGKYPVVDGHRAVIKDSCVVTIE